MSLPSHDAKRGSWSDEELEQYRRRLIRYWKKFYPQRADDLAQEGLLQIWLMEVSAWKGEARLSTYVQTAGINKGRDYLRQELRKQRNMELGGQCLARAHDRILRNPGRYENAMIAYLDALRDDDDQKMAAMRKQHKKSIRKKHEK